MTRLAPIVATAALWWPAAAAAHPRAHHARAPFRPNPIMAAYTIATRYWNASPCHNEVRFDYAPIPEDEGIVSMQSEWASGAGTNTETGAQPFTNCVIRINSAFWISPYQEAVEMWPDFAALMIHEVGHLLGHSHSTDPMSVMYPSPGDQLSWTGLTLWH